MHIKVKGKNMSRTHIFTLANDLPLMNLFWTNKVHIVVHVMLRVSDVMDK